MDDIRTPTHKANRRGFKGLGIRIFRAQCFTRDEEGLVQAQWRHLSNTQRAQYFTAAIELAIQHKTNNPQQAQTAPCKNGHTAASSIPVTPNTNIQPTVVTRDQPNNTVSECKEITKQSHAIQTKANIDEAITRYMQATSVITRIRC